MNHPGGTAWEAAHLGSVRWLVDGMNVVGSRPDGWWRDRPAAMRRLSEELAAFATENGEPITVVFDGRPFDLSAPPIRVEFASTRGRDAADHDIAALVEGDADPASITVVTSDRSLADRVRATGAEVMPSARFRRRLDELADG
jgi:predicted RNA-binding protein with PIN domain